MSNPRPEDRPPIPKGYHYFLLAVAAGIIIGTLCPLLLEYFGVIDFVKNWP